MSGVWIDDTDVVDVDVRFLGLWKNNADGVDVDVLFLGLWKNSTDVVDVDVDVLFLGLWKNRDVDETLSMKFKPSSPHILEFYRFF